MTDPEQPVRRRRRPFVSCTLCRKRKIRCNREHPCSNCVRSRTAETCFYEEHHPPPRPSRTSEPRIAQKPPELDQVSQISSVLSNPSTSTSSFARISNNASTPASSTLSDRDAESLRGRIRQLEEQLSLAQKSTASSDANIDPRFQTETRIFGQDVTLVNRSILHKGRMFGQSHWANGVTLFLDVLNALEPHARKENSAISIKSQRCKHLAKVIKSQWTPAWPTIPNINLPSREIAERLVDGYLRTIEPVYRILHVPTFKEKYEELWLPGNVPDMAFSIQVKMVLAIGSVVYDETFSMRPLAVHWLYEAQTWLSEPEFKSRLNIQAIQTQLLFLLAREFTNIGSTLVWTSVGDLFRTAIYMGLHRDPSYLPKRSMLAVEMHRRLWNTLLEIMLQASIISGGPPLISMDDFDTLPPSNLEDEDLLTEDAVPKPETSLTQTSVAIALRKSFPFRLKVAKFLNDLGSKGAYDEVLRLDTELRGSYKDIRKALLGSTASQFAMQVVDLLMHRYILAVHMPFFGQAMNSTAFAYSRKVVVETSLKVWSAVLSSSSISTPLSSSETASSCQDLERFTTCANGFFRLIAVQACFAVAMELRTQIQEEESLGPVFLRKDLNSVLEEAKGWGLRTVEAGETNIKGYMFTCMVKEQIDGLIQNLPKSEEADRMLKVAEAAEDQCLAILERKAELGGVDQLAQNDFDTPSDMMADWDFTVLDGAYNFGGIDPMNWAFNDGGTQHVSLW